MSEVGEVPIRPASSVVLARDGDAGMELFMLERTSAAVFAGGMHVFPGGRVDEADHDPAYAALCVGPSAVQQGQLRAVGERALGYWIAAIRECFEEAGFLLAYSDNGRMLDLADESVRARFAAHRTAMHEGLTTLRQICTEERILLAVDHMHFYQTWVTPPGRPRRFDTRFFLAEVPATQEGIHDNMETVSSHWITPGDALTRNDEGTFGLMAVTRRQLEGFAEVSSAAALVAMAREAKEFAVHRPTLPS